MAASDFKMFTADNKRWAIQLYRDQWPSLETLDLVFHISAVHQPSIFRFYYHYYHYHTLLSILSHTTLITITVTYYSHYYHYHILLSLLSLSHTTIITITITHYYHYYHYHTLLSLLHSKNTLVKNSWLIWK